MKHKYLKSLWKILIVLSLSTVFGILCYLIGQSINNKTLSTFLYLLTLPAMLTLEYIMFDYIDKLGVKK